MHALRDFDTTITLCLTPTARGQRPAHTSPPLDPQEFADFADTVTRRYVLGDQAAGVTSGYLAGAAPNEAAGAAVDTRPADVGALEADEVAAS